MSRTSQIREQLLSPVGLHAVGFGVLAIATLVLGIRVGLDWKETSGTNMDAMAGRRAELRTLQLQTDPLRHLDKKVELSREQIAEFYAKRIPPEYSVILEQLGDLLTKSNVRLTRVAYTQAPGAEDLTEIRMDAGLSGDYPSIMRFVNGMERNQTFFVIRAMSLTGQQSGAVNLRLQVSTWLRPGDVPNDIPVEGAPSTNSPAEKDSDGPRNTGNGEGQ
jgi:type IV pilus assembly protein PilO